MPRPSRRISPDEVAEITDELQYVTEPVGNKLVNARSILTLRPQEEDNDVWFRCDATNGALQQPLETMVQLSVMREYSAADTGTRSPYAKGFVQIPLLSRETCDFLQFCHAPAFSEPEIKLAG